MLGGVLPRRTKRRATTSRGKVAVTFVVRAAEQEQDEEDKATYKETFDSSTGQMVKTLTQSIEQIDVNGQTWTQRRGSPSGKNKENKKENAVVFIHGLGSRAYTFRQVSVLLQEKGYETFAPDVVGHGDSEKPSSNGGFKYDERSYVDAMETYVEKVANGKQVDLVAQGYVIPQYAILLARERRGKRANGG